MFQVEPILWLQDAASPLLTWIMSAVTFLGYARAYVVVVLFLAFAVRLRPALILLLALLLAGLATEALKSTIAFPRPTDVDARVVDLGAVGARALVATGAATGFLGLPAPEAIAALRAQQNVDYGFPSGHVAGATALAAGLLLFFRPRRGAPVVPTDRPAVVRGLVPFAIAWPLLMATSRLYLGRHFLADVAGGAIVGGLAVIATYALAGWLGAAATPRGTVPRGTTREPMRETSRETFRRHALAAGVAGVASVAVLAAGATWLDAQNSGRLVGMLVALAGLDLIGHRSDAGGPARRLARFALGVGLFLVLQRGTDALLALLARGGGDAFPLAVFAGGGVVLAGALLGTVLLGRRVGLYEVEGVPPLPARR